MLREGEDVGSFGVFLSELNYSRSLFSVVVGMPFPTELLVDNAFTVFAVRHELFFDS